MKEYFLFVIGKFLCYVTLLKKTWGNGSEKKKSAMIFWRNFIYNWNFKSDMDWTCDQMLEKALISQMLLCKHYFNRQNLKKIKKMMNDNNFNWSGPRKNTVLTAIARPNWELDVLPA